MAESGTLKSRMFSAASPETSESVLLSLAMDPDSRVRLALAKRRDLSPKLLAIISENADASMASRLSLRANLPWDVLANLAWHENTDALMNLLATDSVPGRLQRELAAQGETLRREILALSMGSLDADVEQMLASDAQRSVVEALAERDDLSSELVRHIKDRLAKDDFAVEGDEA